MKSQLNFLIVFSILAIGKFLPSQAQEKTFIREYTYRAGEMDSEFTSRKNALIQLKLELINEIGVYVESEKILSTHESRNKFEQGFDEKIRTIQAAIVKVSPIDKRWDGKEYWLKASITIDEENLAKALKDKSASESSDASVNTKLEELSSLKSQYSKSQKSEEKEQIKRRYRNKVGLLPSTFTFFGLSKSKVKLDPVYSYQVIEGDSIKCMRLSSEDLQKLRSYDEIRRNKGELNNRTGSIYPVLASIQYCLDHIREEDRSACPESSLKQDLKEVSLFSNEKGIFIDVSAYEDEYDFYNSHAIKCNHCGAYAKKGEKFCRNCGRGLK